MTDSDFQSTVAYLHPSQLPATPAVEQLRALQQEALREERLNDAAEYGRMVHLMANQRKPEGSSLAIKAIFAAFLAIFLVVAIHVMMF